MEVRATLSHIRIAPKKLRLVATVVSGMDVHKADQQLQYIPKKGSDMLRRTMNSAVANAIHNHEMMEDNLYISRVFVNEGPIYKRWQPRAFGRATPIWKRTSHLTIILNEREEGKRAKKTAKPKDDKEKKAEKEAPPGKARKEEPAKRAEEERIPKDFPKTKERKKEKFSAGKKFASFRDKLFRRKSI